ncbi:MAG TPA: oligopeptide transporter, OPT family [Blastocatellia bacterium]|nr:oligopeptide transporter, OPT family [Blastocatellia bacterium]
MSTETVDTPKAGANEFPDIVGAKPENPYLASFRPYIPASANLREFTALPLIVGTLLGLVFGASSLYLVLKTGLTVSASIPVGVISITLFRALSKMGMRNATILENNTVQTAGSAGESIAFGVGVTMPAILILGFDLEISRVLLVGVLGGLLGILMMIPLRRALIVQQHGLLKYPEGTACAEVLKAGADEESRAAAYSDTTAPVSDVRALPIFTGLGIGFIYKVATDAFLAWKGTPERVFGEPFKAGSISAEINPALLGVGYIIGPQIASIMCAGGVLAYLVLIPLIKFFGDNIPGPLAPGTVPISEMTHQDVRDAYVLYIGAGAVAAGGIISVLRSLPMIWHGLKGGLKDVGKVQTAEGAVPRTERDLPIKVVLGGSILLVVLIAFANPLYAGGVGVITRIAAAILIVIFGFLFVTVSSRLTGEIGSSSNPISGMTVATLLLVCLIFLLLHWTGQNYYVTALSLGAIVCIASSNGGTTSQALKTGHILGATPKAQQYAILIGSLSSALLLGPILLALNNAGTVYVPLANNPTIGFPGDFRVNPADLLMDGSQPKSERLHGSQGKEDPGSYHVWFHTPSEGANAAKYLVNDEGVPVYLADPAINGTYTKRPDGTDVSKYNAPKATLMSYIIKGILSQRLPWGLVLLGAMIAIVLEMSGIPSLAFAVGVYLPLSASTPIFIGGLIRWLVDKYVRKKFARHNFTEDQLVAESDKSPGVLMASGYIAGGALAGIIVAIMSGWEGLAGFNKQISDWANTSNPFFSGPNSDLLSLIPFLIICILLYLAGREVILAGKKDRART